MEKLIISYDELNNLIVNLYNKINIVFTPDIIIGIGTGGWLPAKLINKRFNIELDSIKLSSYDGKQQGQIKPSNLNSLNLDYLKNKRVLVIDDVNDTGATLKYIVELLSPLTTSLHIGVLHHKDKDKESDLFLDNRCIYYFADRIDDIWVEYPWDS
jgi:uncharacterized protein